MPRLIRTKLFACVALLLLTVSASANADETAYVFHRPNFKDKSQDKPVVKPAGEIELNGGVKVPVFSLAMVSGRQDDREIFRPQVKHIDIDVKPEVAARLAAYAYQMGIILVPKSWQAWSAAVGADGSMALLFAPDASGQNYLSYSNSGACVGCALFDASLYFDEAKKQAKEYEFTYYSRPASLKMVRLNQLERAYNIGVKSGNPVDGLAHYNGEDDFPFFDVQVSLDKADHDLATVILNQFRIAKSRK